MRLRVTNADYSGSGLGTTDWVASFAQVAGVTDPTKIDAMHDLYDDCVAASIWSKIGGIAFFPGSTSASQKYIFKDVPLGESFKELVFTGNGSSANGWTPGNNIYAVAPYTPAAGNFGNVSFGFYNNTGESAPGAGSFRRSMQIADNTSPANYNIMMSRWYSDTVLSPAAQLGLNSGGDLAFPTSGTFPTADTGFLQAVKNGNTLRLIEDGTTVFDKTNATQVPVGGGTRQLVLGTAMLSNGSASATSLYSTARYAFFYWGSLTLTEAVTFNTIVHNFLTAFGRA